MSEVPNQCTDSTYLGPVNSRVLGYNDHEYDKAIHVVVEKIADSEPAVQGRTTKTKKDDLSLVTEAADLFSCGVCGKLYSKLLALLSHRATHITADSGMTCELCECSTVFTKPSVFSQHYKTYHNVILPNEAHTKTYKNSSKRKQTAGKKSLNQSPVRKKVLKGLRNKIAQNKEEFVILPELPKPNSSETHPESPPGSLDPTVDEQTTANSSVEGFDQTEPENIPIIINIEKDPSGETSAMVDTSITNSTDLVQNSFTSLEKDHTISQVQSDNDKQNVLVTFLEPTGGTAKDEREQAISIQTTTSSLTGESDKEVDFYFLLVTGIARGSSFVYGKQSFKCLHCDYKTFWKNAFIKHMKDKHVEVLSQNEFIEMRTTESPNNQKLMKMSEFIENYQNPVKSKEKRRYAKQPSDKFGSYPCTSCDKVFSRWGNLRKHMRIHVPTKNFLCVECGKAFKTKTSLQQHTKRHQKEIFTCSVCGFQSEVSAAIQAHRQFHSEGSVLCDICGNAYTDKSTLKKHKRVHDPNRPFGCPWPECTWRFKSEMMCNGHYRSHMSDAQFRCLYCGYAFRHKHHLRRHERRSHGVQHKKSRVSHSKGNELAEEEQAVTNISLLNPNIEEVGVTSLVESEGQLYIPVAADDAGNALPFKFEISSVAYQTILQNSLAKATSGTVYI